LDRGVELQPNSCFSLLCFHVLSARVASNGQMSEVLRDLFVDIIVGSIDLPSMIS
jgi:hypothetical protein